MSTIHLNVTWLTYLAGTLIPLLVAIVAKLHASSTVKALVNLFLVVLLAGINAAIADNGTVYWKQFLTTFVITFVVAGTSYAHLWKPLGTIDQLGGMTQFFGLGKVPPWAVPDGPVPPQPPSGNVNTMLPTAASGADQLKNNTPPPAAEG